MYKWCLLIWKSRSHYYGNTKLLDTFVSTYTCSNYIQRHVVGIPFIFSEEIDISIKPFNRCHYVGWYTTEKAVSVIFPCTHFSITCYKISKNTVLFKNKCKDDFANRKRFQVNCSTKCTYSAIGSFTTTA